MVADLRMEFRAARLKMFLALQVEFPGDPDQPPSR